MRALQLAFIISLFLGLSSGLDVSPSNPNPGDTITITGSASPNQDVSLRSSFSMDLPLAGDRYEYETSVTVPQKPNRITVTARNVQDFNAGVKIGIWITKGFTPSGGTVSLSKADVPSGEYNLKMFGAALPGSTAVPVSVTAETEVKADSQGRYSLNIDTSGVPAGEYRIEANGEAKTIQIGIPGSGSGQAEENTTEKVQSTPPPEPLEITPEVVLWYANKTDIKVEVPGQLEQAEDRLYERLEGGYWKIIVLGEPLTEEAGNCLQEYCLVRGIGACISCRQKDMILKAGQPPASSIRPSENQTQPKATGEKTGLWSSITKWLGKYLRILAGAVSNTS